MEWEGWWVVKAVKRMVPRNDLSVEQRGDRVSVFQDGQRITCMVFRGNKVTATHQFTFDQFANLWERLAPGIDHHVS